jgi:hypothetical protein
LICEYTREYFRIPFNHAFRCGCNESEFLQKWPEALQGTTVLLGAFGKRGGMIIPRASKNGNPKKDRDGIFRSMRSIFSCPKFSSLPEFIYSFYQ